MVLRRNIMSGAHLETFQILCCALHCSDLVRCHYTTRSRNATESTANIVNGCSGAFADDKSYYCGLSTIDVGTAVEDMAEFRSAPVDLSCPKFAPSEELETDSHDQQMDFEDPPERASSKPSFEF
jgi:hypothetical protein